MRLTRLGRTGLEVSGMGLGCGGHSRLGLAVGKTEDHAVGIVHAALDLGVNFLDTAESYGTEEIVGRALTGRSRSAVVLSTKVAPRQKEGLLSAERLRERVEGCLRRLKTDHIDVLHLHGVAAADYAHCRTELVPELLALKTSGKIRFAGITEIFAVDTRHEMLQLALRDDPWDVVMVGFNFLNQSARERVLEQTRQRAIGTLCMFAVRRAISRGDILRESLDHLVDHGQMLPAQRAQFEALVPEDDRVDTAYRFCRDEPGIDIVLVGTGDRAHLEANAASLNAPPLPDPVASGLRRVFAGLDHLSGN